MTVRFTIRTSSSLFYPDDITLYVTVEASNFDVLTSMIPEAVEWLSKVKRLVEDVSQKTENAQKD